MRRRTAAIAMAGFVGIALGVVAGALGCGGDGASGAGAGSGGDANTSRGSVTETGAGGDSVGSGGHSAGSGVEAAGGGGGSEGTLEEACAAVDEALCNKYAECVPEVLALYYVDLETCIAVADRGCIAAADLPGIAYTAAAIFPCADAYANASCERLFADSTPIPACDGVFTGTLPADSPCAANAQCASAECVARTPDGCGVCSTEGVAGDDCTIDTVTCAEGLFCDAAGSCEANLALGQPCVDGDVCAGANGCVAGTCGPRLGVGGACASNDECDLGQDLLCSGLTNTCEVFGGYPLAGAAEMCGYDAGAMTYTLCTADAHWCHLIGAVGTCVADLDDGQPCDADLQAAEMAQQCQAGSACLSGICTAMIPVCN
jgi:hypothetical protein